MISCSLSLFAGESQRHRPGSGSELRLRLKHRHPTPRPWGRDLHQAGRREGTRREQQQVQHFRWLHSVQ